jgi:hypothetical protein
MSLAQVRTALETALNSITPAIATAWENAPYSPVAGTPYQQVTLLRAQPDNPEIGAAFAERGFLQVNLFYPKDAGPGAAEARAELIRAAFPFGASLTSGGVTVNIIATPEVAPARAEDDRFLVPVRVRFSAFIGG